MYLNHFFLLLKRVVNCRAYVARYEMVMGSNRVSVVMAMYDSCTQLSPNVNNTKSRQQLQPIQYKSKSHSTKLVEENQAQFL